MHDIIQRLLNAIVDRFIESLPLLLQMLAIAIALSAFRPIRLQLIQAFHRYVGWRGVWLLVLAFIVLQEAMRMRH
jgi:hypothetical protein